MQDDVPAPGLDFDQNAVKTHLIASAYLYPQFRRLLSVNRHPA
jgi:hypothetical protein